MHSQGIPYTANLIVPTVQSLPYCYKEYINIILRRNQATLYLSRIRL